MTDITTQVRAHYSATNLVNRIKSALATIAPEERTLTVAQLAPLDQFWILTSAFYRFNPRTWRTESLCGQRASS